MSNVLNPGNAPAAPRTRGPRSRYTLADMQRIAAERGGACLSPEYVNSTTHLTWRCSDGHVWQAMPHNIIQHRSWCRHCSVRPGRRRPSARWSPEKRDERLSLLHDLAQARGGQCLDAEYLTSGTKYNFLCAAGHQFQSRVNSVRRGHWCAACAGNLGGRITLDVVREIARARDGLCLSTDYRGSRHKLHFQCAEGHRWEVNPSHVARGSWCPQCCFDRMRGTLAEMIAIAVARGGQCLSTEYHTARTRLHWECHLGHRWWASPDNVKNKRSWCPQCALAAFTEGGERKRRTRRAGRRI